jgi:hypothetical protein
MGSGKMWQWFIGKIFLKSNSINEKISLIPLLAGPLFHVRGINIVPRKTALIFPQWRDTISETLIREGKEKGMGELLLV